MKSKPSQFIKAVAARGGILLYFIIAFEVLIMISPFAFFFYSVFNPVFHFLNEIALTRWLTDFFLPHMILPPTMPLKVIRVLGSIFFVVGCVTFIICAIQIYLGKILKWGVADRGIYQIIRHPQYTALGIWGIGMSILWPRFFVLLTLSIMFVLYFFLAENEEQRMLNQHGQAYEKYRQRTGRFLPQSLERIFYPIPRLISLPSLRYTLVPVLVMGGVLTVGILCRYLTINSLPMKTQSNVTVVPILPEEATMIDGVWKGIFGPDSTRDPSLPFLDEEKDYLGYLMPVDYIMQGMIADTGGEFHLHKHHHTLALIYDWVMHPFEHLRRSPMAHMAKLHGMNPQTARAMHCPLGEKNIKMVCADCPYRRVVFVEINHNFKGHLSGSDLLGYRTVRIPVGYIDVDTETGEIVNQSEVGSSTAWKGVPTPAI